MTSLIIEARVTSYLSILVDNILRTWSASRVTYPILQPLSLYCTTFYSTTLVSVLNNFLFHNLTLCTVQLLIPQPQSLYCTTCFSCLEVGTVLWFRICYRTRRTFPERNQSLWQRLNSITSMQYICYTELGCNVLKKAADVFFTQNSLQKSMQNFSAKIYPSTFFRSRLFKEL